MTIQSLPLDAIQPYEKNPRRNDKAVKFVAESISRFGFRVPIIIDKSQQIVAGHTRYKAAQQLGLVAIPCIMADDLSEDQVRAFRLADNKVSELAEWDNDLLAVELADMSDFNMADFGFDPRVLSADQPQPFKEFGEEIETSHRCPKCGYEWS